VLGERIMRALILRRVGLLESGSGGPIIKRGVFGWERLVKAGWVGHGILLQKICGYCGSRGAKDGHAGAKRTAEIDAVPFGLCGVHPSSGRGSERGVSCWTFGRKVSKITTQRSVHWTMKATRAGFE
jgi:hypothetical protein